MTTFILIIMLHNYSHSSVAVTTAEFVSKARCETAASEILSRKDINDEITAICVMK